MTRAEDGQDSDPGGWIEALHESIALRAGVDVTPSDSRGLPSEEYEEIRDCLTLLERARRSQAQGAPRQVGRFEIVREIGRGGFGVVFAALDPRVGRQVALKIPKPEVLVNPAARSRFLREAKAAGVLSHPNLIPIFEVGEAGPLFYIASALCDGPNLAQWLGSPHEPVSDREAARLVEDLALGVDHAHRRGVLHRDIKPSNILFEQPGDGPRLDRPRFALADMTPRLTDFGLAKIAQSGEDETRAGLLLGTPAYMAPEQAEGRLEEVGAATDVYALGVVLFELLAGEAPHRGNTDVQTLQRVARGDTPRLSSFRPHVPPDLEAVVLKCLQREPQTRYATAEALADDLRKFRRGEPTLARPAGRVDRTLKWIKRRPAMAALAAVLVAAATALSGGGWWYSSQLRAALDQTQLERHKADSHERETTRHLYAASLTLANQAINTNHVGAAQEHLARWIPGPDQPDQRSAAWHYLWRQIHEEEQTLTGHEGEVYCVRYSPDGRLLVTASQDKTARIWDVASGKCLRVLADHKREINCVAFSRGGDLVATASDDGTVRVWRVSDGAVVSRKTSHAKGAFGVEFSPTDDRLLASCGADRTAKILDITTDKYVTTCQGHGATLGALTFSPDGRYLATASDDNSARVFDVKTGKQVMGLTHGGAVSCLSYSNDGSRLLTGQRVRRVVRMFEIIHNADGELEHGPRKDNCHTTYDWIHAVAYHPSNDYYAVATKDGSVVLLSSRDDVVLRRLRGHGTRVWSLSFSSDGKYLATASADRTVKIWNLADRSDTIDDSARVQAIALAADGRTMVSGNTQGGLALYDLETRKQIWRVGRTFDVIGDFDGDGRRDSGFFSDGTWRLILAGQEGAPADNPREQVVQFGADGDLPVVGDWDGDGRDNLGYYHPDDGQWMLDLDGQGGAAEQTCNLHLPGPLPYPTCVPLIGRWASPERDSVGLAVAHTQELDRWTYWFQRADEVLPIHVDNGRVDRMPVAGRWLTGRANGWGVCDLTRTWINDLPEYSVKQSAMTRSERARRVSLSTPNPPLDAKVFDVAGDLSDDPRVRALALSPDGRRLAVAHTDSPRVTIWDLPGRRRIVTFRPTAEATLALAFANDNTLITGSTNAELSFFDATTLEPVQKIKAHKSRLWVIASSPAHQLLATLGNGEVKIWDTDGSPLTTLHDPSMATANCLAISPDGTQIAVAGSDRIAYVWNWSAGEKIAALAGHTFGVTSVAFSSDQRCLATASEDGSIKLWDLATRQELYTLAENLRSLNEVAFVGNDLIATGPRAIRDGQTGAIHFWSAGRPGNAPARD